MKRMPALFFVIYSSIIVPATPLSYPFKNYFIGVTQFLVNLKVDILANKKGQKQLIGIRSLQNLITTLPFDLPR